MSPTAFNQAKGALKLGSAPLQEHLAEETKRVLKEEIDVDMTMADGEPGMSAKARRLAAAKQDLNLIKPEPSDLLPRPLLFRTVDVRREVEKVRDARKRIRLEPSAVTASDAELSLDRASLFAKSGALPSICAYTFHDAQDRWGSPDFLVRSHAHSSFVVSARPSSPQTVRLWLLGLEKAISAYGA